MTYYNCFHNCDKCNADGKGSHKVKKSGLDKRGDNVYAYYCTECFEQLDSASQKCLAYIELTHANFKR